MVTLRSERADVGAASAESSPRRQYAARSQQLPEILALMVKTVVGQSCSQPHNDAESAAGCIRRLHTARAALQGCMNEFLRA